MPRSLQNRITISCLWTFIGLNMVFADVLSLYTPGTLPQLLEGTTEGVVLSEQLMLIAAVFLQVALVMIVLTQLLPGKACRYANMLAVVITSAFVIGGGSAKLHYLFFASCEVAAMLCILALAWRLEEPTRAS